MIPKKEIEEEIKECKYCLTQYPDGICMEHKLKLEGYQKAQQEVLKIIENIDDTFTKVFPNKEVVYINKEELKKQVINSQSSKRDGSKTIDKPKSKMSFSLSERSSGSDTQIQEKQKSL